MPACIPSRQIQTEGLLKFGFWEEGRALVWENSNHNHDDDSVLQRPKKLPLLPTQQISKMLSLYRLSILYRVN